RLEDLAIAAVLLLFAGWMVSLEKEKFRAIEPHPLGAVRKQRGNLLDEFHVAEQLDPIAVGGDRRQILHLEGDLLRRLVTPPRLREESERLHRRVDKNRAFVPIEATSLPRRVLIGPPRRTAPRGYFPRPGDDGGVAGVPAEIGDKTGDPT